MDFQLCQAIPKVVVSIRICVSIHPLQPETSTCSLLHRQVTAGKKGGKRITKNSEQIKKAKSKIGEISPICQ